MKTESGLQQNRTPASLTADDQKGVIRFVVRRRHTARVCFPPLFARLTPF